MSEAGTLQVVREAKLADLLADVLPRKRGEGRLDPQRLEGSGVVRAGGRLWVVFDNLALVAGLDPGLAVPDPTAQLVAVPADLTDVEDIAHDEPSGHFYVVVEGRHTGSKPPRPLVAELDRDWRPVATKWVDVPLVKVNKGIEGLEVLRREGALYLLGLLEGNRGLAGKAGRRYGGGRVHVLVEDDERWRSVATIDLPETLRFHDYSAISVAGDRVAVLSQESSAMWIGQLAPDTWAIMDDGVVYGFPTDRSGHTVYRTIEGVTWLTERQLAVVSDRDSTKPTSTARDKDQSVHLVELPSRG